MSLQHLRCRQGGCSHNFHRTQSHQSLCPDKLCATTLKESEEMPCKFCKLLYELLNVKPVTCGCCYLGLFLKGCSISLHFFVSTSSNHPSPDRENGEEISKRPLNDQSHKENDSIKWINILTHRFAVYTEASKQEQGGVRYCCERMPRSAHWRGRHRNSGKQILHSAVKDKPD